VFLRFAITAQMTKPAIAATPSATPIPMPAFAATGRPDSWIGAAVVDVGADGVIVLDGAREEALDEVVLVLEADVLEADVLAVWAARTRNPALEIWSVLGE